MVLVQQIRLFRDTTTEAPAARKVLLAIVAISLLSNVLPIAIDVATIFGWDRAGSLLIPYALNNVISMTLMAIGWWILLRISERANKLAAKEHDELVADNKSLAKDNKTLRNGN
jgi:hypothetical protein